MTRHQAPPVDEITERWPQTARESAQTVLDKYGQSVEMPHHFPTPHIDVLGQAIDYRMPVEGVNFLALNLRGDTGDPDQQLIDS